MPERVKKLIAFFSVWIVFAVIAIPISLVLDNLNPISDVELTSVIKRDINESGYNIVDSDNMETILKDCRSKKSFIISVESIDSYHNASDVTAKCSKYRNSWSARITSINY